MKNPPVKETEDKTKEGTLQVDQGTDAMTLVLGKEKGGYARGVGSGVTYKRREREEKELLIKSMSSKMSQTEGKVSPVEIHPINSSADEEGGTTVVGCDQNDASIRKEMQKRETVKSVGAKKTTRSIRKDSSSQDSQSKENVSVLPQHSPKDIDNKVSIVKSLVDATFIPDVGSNGCTTVLELQ
ncbi:hypothetical protein Tco_0718388 [Tanacetum coccineum]